MQNIELVDSSDFKDQKKYIIHLLQKYITKRTLKIFLYIILWLIGGRVLRLFIQKISIIYHLQGLYVIVSGFVLIFMNLGTKEKGSLSAYSVFNKGCKELLGTFNERDINNMYNVNKKGRKESFSDEEEENNVKGDFDNLSVDQMMSKLNKLGNKRCFCDSGRKYKKCHYYIHQRQKQDEAEELKQKRKKNI